MSQKTFNLTIARVDGAVFSGQALSITVPGVEGEMTILPGHVALVSPLRPGVLTVRTEEVPETTYDVTVGTLEVSNNQVTVLL